MNKFILDNGNFEDLLLEMDKEGEGFIAVVDPEGLLIGVVTDGDVRRAILNKKDDLKEIINYNPMTALIGTSSFEAKKILKKSRRRHLPIVDKDNKLVEIVKLDNWEDFSRKNKVVIMAGGLGSRLEELTKEVPKPMLPMGNRPILEHIILNFMHQGYLDFILAVNYKSHVIKEYFKDGSELGVNIEYVEEDERKGTAGALSLIDSELKEPFIVINGDILTAIDFVELIDYHEECQADATMCLAQKGFNVDYGVVKIDEEENVLSIKEKPKYEFFINAGIYIFNPDILKLIPKDRFYDMTSLFDLLKEKSFNVKGYKMRDYWLDIGLKKDYYQAIESVKNKPI